MLQDKKDMIALLTGVKSSKKNYYTEMKHTVEQLQKKNMQLEIINEVMKSININSTFNQILKNVIDKLRGLMPCDIVSLLLLKNDELILSNVYPENRMHITLDSVIPFEHSLYWSALKNNQTIHKILKNTQDNFFEKESLIHSGIKTVIVLPLTMKNKEIGVFSIGRQDDSKWSEDDVAFLQQLTDHLAISIENTQLYNEVLKRKQQWEDTFKAVDDMIFIFDHNLNLLQCNDKVKSFFNLTEECPSFSFLGESCRAFILDTFRTQKPGYMDLYFHHNKICESYTYLIQNNQCEVYGVILYMKDVTEKRKMEAQLLHSGKLAAIGEMAAGVAHELNSPLTAILGNSQLLLRNRPADDLSHQLLKDIKNCGDRCKQIIKSLLTFSRQDEYTFESFSLNDAIQQVMYLLKYQLEKSDIEIELDLLEHLPLIEGSQQQIEQVIVNLILNARDALELSDKPLKHMRIRTFLLHNEVHLTVEDNGIGIEEHRLSEIFHPFYTTKESDKGTGLGLSVSFGIAESHGGTIDVLSQIHNGSTFTLRIPLLPAKVLGVRQ